MKFSIRDLLLVTVIVALAVGWAVDHHRRLPTKLTQSEVEELERRNEALEGSFDDIDRQLAAHELQLEQNFYWGLGGRKEGRMEVVPLHLPTSQAPAPNPPKK